MFKLKDTLNGLDTKAAKITKIVSNITLSLQKKGMEPTEIRSNLSKYVTAAKKLVTDTSADISDKAFKKSLKELEKFVGVKVNEDLDIMQDIDELEKQKKQPWFRGSRQSGKNKVINKQIADLQTAAETKSIDDLVSKYANPGDVKGSNSDDLKTAQKLLDENKGGIFSSKKKKANRKKAESIQEGFDKAARLQNKTSFKGVDPKTDEQVRMQRVFDALPGELKERAYDFAGDMKEAKANVVKQVMQQGKLTLSDIERKYKGYADGTDDVNSREFKQNIDEPTYLRQESALKGRGESANRKLGSLYRQARNLKNMDDTKLGKLAGDVRNQLLEIGNNFRDNVYNESNKVTKARAEQNRLEKILDDADKAKKKLEGATAKRDAYLEDNELDITSKNSKNKTALSKATTALGKAGINTATALVNYQTGLDDPNLRATAKYRAAKAYIEAKNNNVKSSKDFDEVKAWKERTKPKPEDKPKTIDNINTTINTALDNDNHPTKDKNKLYEHRTTASEFSNRIDNLRKEKEALLKTTGHYPSDIEAIDNKISLDEQRLNALATEIESVAKNPNITKRAKEKVKEEQDKIVSKQAEDDIRDKSFKSGREAAIKTKGGLAGGASVVGDTISDTADSIHKKAVDSFVRAGASVQEAREAASKFAEKNLTGDTGNKAIDEIVAVFNKAKDTVKTAANVGGVYKDEAGNWAETKAANISDAVDNWASEDKVNAKSTQDKLDEFNEKGGKGEQDYQIYKDFEDVAAEDGKKWSKLDDDAKQAGVSREEYIRQVADKKEARRLLKNHFTIYGTDAQETDHAALKKHFDRANKADAGWEDFGKDPDVGTSSTGMDEDINQQDIDSKLNRNLGEPGVDVGQSSTDTPDEPPGNDGPDGKNDKGWIRRGGEWVAKAPIRAAGAVAGTTADITKDVAGGVYDGVKGGAKLGGKVFGPAAVGEGFGLISDTLRGAKNYYDTPAGEESDQYLRDRADDAFRIMESIPGALKLSYDDYSTMLDQGEYGAIAGRLGLAAQDAMQSGFKGATNAAYSLYDAIDAITRGEGEEDGFVYEDYALGKDRGWTNQAKYDTGVDPLEYHPSQQSDRTKALMSKVAAPGGEGDVNLDPAASQQQDKQVARQQQQQAKAHAASPMGRAQNWAGKYDDVGVQGLYQSNGYQRPIYKSTTPGVASFGDTPMQVAGGGMGQYDYNAAEAQTEANVLQGYKDIRAKAEESAKPYYLKGYPSQAIARLTPKEHATMKLDYDRNMAAVEKANAKATEKTMSLASQASKLEDDKNMNAARYANMAKNLTGPDKEIAINMGRSKFGQETGNNPEVSPIMQLFGATDMSASDWVNWSDEDKQSFIDGNAKYDTASNEMRTSTGRAMQLNSDITKQTAAALYGHTGPEEGDTPEQTAEKQMFNAGYDRMRNPEKYDIPPQ